MDAALNEIGKGAEAPGTPEPNTAEATGAAAGAATAERVITEVESGMTRGGRSNGLFMVNMPRLLSASSPT